MDRMRRVNELLQREIGHILERLICPDHDCLITVAKVDCSPNLRNAKVAISVMGSEEQKKAVFSDILNERKEIQSRMSKAVTLKYTPKLHFDLDYKMEDAANIIDILAKLDEGEEDGTK
ncbi:MAG: 30S ribosome-binding factor RbfA [Lentisphaeria bacterium]|nr:30S ribosome-binding factor RbfA [Lentisphaeria bacterium]